MFAKAKQSYERSLKIKIENPLAPNIGVILEKLGNNEQAIDYYAKAVVVQPDYLDALFNLSVILQKCDKVSEVIIFIIEY